MIYCNYRVLLALHRIKAQYEQFVSSEMSERNAKHNFIDYCQAMPGYGCRFYKLKARISQNVPALVIYHEEFFFIIRFIILQKLK